MHSRSSAEEKNWFSSCVAASRDAIARRNRNTTTQIPAVNTVWMASSNPVRRRHGPIHSSRPMPTDTNMSRPEIGIRLRIRTTPSSRLGWTAVNPSGCREISRTSGSGMAIPSPCSRPPAIPLYTTPP